MTTQKPDIIWTIVDEAPELASASLLPIVQSFTKTAGVTVGTKDISLAGRILASFSDYLTDDQKKNDDLKELGQLTQEPGTVIIKLPNISAVESQLVAAIKELQSQGYALPNYPENPPEGSAEAEIKTRYSAIIGSVVNPVLRKGNAVRIIPAAVKEDAQRNPHKMGTWNKNSKTRMMYMESDDFRSSEISAIVKSGTAQIEYIPADGSASQILKDGIKLNDDEIVDIAVMNRKALSAFLEDSVATAKKEGLLWSVHLKATMMVKTDGVMFGDAVKAYFKPVFDNHGETLARIGFDPKNGIGDIPEKIKDLPQAEREAIEHDIAACLRERADMAYVKPKEGVTNLDSPNLVIIDASLPKVIRWSGQMEDATDTPRDTLCVVPDSSYTGMYQVAIDDMKAHGALDPTTMGSVDNIGLMANKAEEYGSKDKTFIAPGNGTIRVVDGSGNTILEKQVETGDIWRMCQTQDPAIRNWVGLAVDRARSTNTPAVFWLDDTRAHDKLLIEKVKTYLKNHNTDGLTIEILSPVKAMEYTMPRVRAGQNTMAVTGNVLRDYVTDLFPILEVSTSSKMLSLVPLLNGGLVAETGSGGTAPLHVDQLVQEGHLRWNSLGEALALIEALRHLKNDRATILADTLERAACKLLEENKSPSSRAGEPDTRDSHYYLALYWAEELGAQDKDAELKEQFIGIARALHENGETIAAELDASEGKPADIGGYFNPNPEKLSTIMRSSPTLNDILAF